MRPLGSATPSTGESAAARGRPFWPPSAAVLLACWALQSCAAPGPARPFRFESNRPAPDAFACALAVLARNDFEIVESVPDSGRATALRSPSEADPVDAREWWRVELSATAGEQVPTVVAGTSGVSSRRDGPYRQPGPTLEHVVGEVSARCVWGQVPPGG